jgi:hypothetical protein
MEGTLVNKDWKEGVGSSRAPMIVYVAMAVDLSPVGSQSD